MSASMLKHHRNAESRETTKARRKTAVITILSIFTLFMMLAGCGGGAGSSDGVSAQQSGAASTEVVTGVASAGAPLAGVVTLKDASTPPREKQTVIAGDGSFALDVTGMKRPFMLQAAGGANGVNYKLHSFAEGPENANINPLSNAVVASAAGGDDPEEVYKNPDAARLEKIRDGLPRAIADLLARLSTLLRRYGAEGQDPVRGAYKADHTGLDAMLDDVKITIENGILTITNVKTGATILTVGIRDLKGGYDDDDAMPKLGSVPPAPAGVTGKGGDKQITVSWSAAAGATSYNLYWSTTPGVSKASGTKKAGVTSPYVHTGLSAGATYYYVITAVNSSGESAPSSQASAATSGTPNPNPNPTPTVPGAPTGVSATGGTNQVTISWAAVTGMSYNIYWSMTPGVTKATGTKIAGATSPTVQTGLAAGTTYYYIATAINGAGEGAASAQVSATTLTPGPAPAPTPPSAPTSVTASGGANQVTVSWAAVTGAVSYNLYWSAAPGVTTSTGTRISGATSPYAQTGLAAGTPYYYVVTAVNAAGESAASSQVTATTNAPTPAFDAPGYYNTNCSTCHGGPSSFSGGRTAADLQGAIDGNAGGMRRFNTLTPDQVAAIAAVLGP